MKAWGVERQPSYFKHKLISLVMLVAAGLLLLGALLVVTAANITEAGWFAEILARAPALEQLRGFAFRWATTFTFIFVVGLIACCAWLIVTWLQKCAPQVVSMDARRMKKAA